MEDARQDSAALQPQPLELPQDVLELLLSHSSITDIDRLDLSQVCRAWRRAALATLRTLAPTPQLLVAHLRWCQQQQQQQLCQLEEADQGRRSSELGKCPGAAGSALAGSVGGGVLLRYRRLVTLDLRRCRQLPLSAAIQSTDEATTNTTSGSSGSSGVQGPGGSLGASAGGWDGLVAAALAVLAPLQVLLVEQGMELGPSCFGPHGHPHLSRLDLSGCSRMRWGGLQPLALLPSLKHLSLAHCAWVSAPDVGLLPRLAPRLTSLDLSGCCGAMAEGDGPLAALCRGLRGQLQELRLCDLRRVTDDTCLAIAAALAPPAPTPLEQPFREASPPPYTISPQLPPDNKTQAATAPAAAVTPDCHVSAAAGPVLRVLGCARVSPLLGEEGLAALAGALATCLTCLDLSGNAHLEGRALATLTGLTRLQDLALRGCRRLVGSDVGHLAPALGPSLARLDLRGVLVTSPRGTGQLRSFPQLRELQLDGDGPLRWTLSGQLARLLNASTGLTRLHFANWRGPATGRAAAAAAAAAAAGGPAAAAKEQSGAAVPGGMGAAGAEPDESIATATAAAAAGGGCDDGGAGGPTAPAAESGGSAASGAGASVAPATAAENAAVEEITNGVREAGGRLLSLELPGATGVPPAMLLAVCSWLTHLQHLDLGMMTDPWAGEEPPEGFELAGPLSLHSLVLWGADLPPSLLLRWLPRLRSLRRLDVRACRRLTPAHRQELLLSLSSLRELEWLAMDSRHAHGGNSSGEEDRSASNSGSGGGRAATAAEPVQGEPGDKELPGRGQQAATALDVDAEDTAGAATTPGAQRCDGNGAAAPGGSTTVSRRVLRSLAVAAEELRQHQRMAAARTPAPGSTAAAMV